MRPAPPFLEPNGLVHTQVIAGNDNRLGELQNTF